MIISDLSTRLADPQDPDGINQGQPTMAESSSPKTESLPNRAQAESETKM